MTTLALAEVRDLDCVVSFAPFRLGLTAREVTGVAAILRRVLYAWCIALGSVDDDPTLGVTVPILDLEGIRFSPSGRAAYALELQAQAEAQDYVRAAAVSVTLDDAGRLRISAQIQLVDGQTYPLEVTSVNAASAITASLGVAA